VVMVGEIRDLETAEIAVQASLTGHLVLSTLHTNTAIGAVTRLQDMGIEPFLLSSSMIAVMAQRLVRLLCMECREAHPATDSEAQWLGLSAGSNPIIYRPVGCDHCSHSGYRGRTGIYELIEIDEDLRTMIHAGAGEQEMVKQARQRTPGIQQDGWRRILAGETSMEEVMRVTAAA
jgi:general secretion pathway protein E